MEEDWSRLRRCLRKIRCWKVPSSCHADGLVFVQRVAPSSVHLRRSVECFGANFQATLAPEPGPLCRTIPRRLRALCACAPSSLARFKRDQAVPVGRTMLGPNLVETTAHIGSNRTTFGRTEPRFGLERQVGRAQRESGRSSTSKRRLPKLTPHGPKHGRQPAKPRVRDVGHEQRATAAANRRRVGARRCRRPQRRTSTAPAEGVGYGSPPPGSTQGSQGCSKTSRPCMSWGSAREVRSRRDGLAIDTDGQLRRSRLAVNSAGLLGCDSHLAAS